MYLEKEFRGRSLQPRIRSPLIDGVQKSSYEVICVQHVEKGAPLQLFCLIPLD